MKLRTNSSIVFTLFSQSSNILPMNNNRLPDLIRFYGLLADLERRIGGIRKLADCSGRMDWPKRGIYFFQETGESRVDSGVGFRIVRVGTHALKAGSRTKLWTRLSHHKGVARSGGGNHRGSVFRLIVGAANIEKDGHRCSSWGQGSSAPRDIRDGEFFLEQIVSRIIGEMPFVWLPVDDEPGPSSLRGYIERNAIALLSNYGNSPIDPPSPNWLGHSCDRKRVRTSGLWNSNHVDDIYDPAFLDTLNGLVGQIGSDH